MGRGPRLFSLHAATAPAWTLAASFLFSADPVASQLALEALAGEAGQLCQAADSGSDAAAARLGAELIEERVFGPEGAAFREQWRFRREGGSELVAILIRPGGVLRRLVLEHHVAGGSRPEGMVMLDGSCAMQHARRIDYGRDGMAEALRLFGSELEPIGEQALNPPLPASPEDAEPPRVIVALFDSGIAYDLPEVAERLVFAETGKPFGYDFWDMDERPFDADTSRSAFFPMHHGTPVASVLLREAPDARIVPFRYPRPEMERMGAMVVAAAQAGARIVSMPMGSNDRGDWTAFADAARRHDELLFVLSAGNDGRDLDEAPLWPAALGLENAIVVTSGEATGELAAGSNWGAETVDLMVPAENVEVFDHLGRPGRGAGTSYAVPRIAALAARILADDPQMGTAELKAAVLARAEPSPDARGPFTRHGWIADPAQD